VKEREEETKKNIFNASYKIEANDGIVDYLVYRSKATFPKLVCSIKIVCGNFNLSKGKKTSL
jgi:hypothetical protein